MYGRRLLLSVLLVALLLYLAFATTASGQSVPPAQQGMEKVLIAFDRAPGAAERALVGAFGGKVKRSYHLVPAVAATIPTAAVDALRHNPTVAAIEPDVEVHALDLASELQNSWGVERINADDAWGTPPSNTGKGVNVAIIDSGIDCDHFQLKPNCAGGYDFVNDDTDPTDDNGHGTHVAGTVAAVLDGEGVVGVAPDAHLYALKVLGASGSGSFSDVIAALEWAVDNGIQVTNNSYGSSRDPGTITHNAFDAAYAAGILNVAAAGNEGKVKVSLDNVIYPAKYSSVVAVAATDSNDARAAFSSTGPAVELAAPGVDINSTKMGGGYTTLSGTSMATPHVVGAAALVLADGVTDTNGDGRVNDEVRARLTSTATDLGTSGRDNAYGYGLVNALAAVNGSEPPPPVSVDVTDFSPPVLMAGTSAPMTVTGSGFQSAAKVTFEGGSGPTPTASVDSVSSDGTAITGTMSVKATGAPGDRIWNVRVTNPDGGSDLLTGQFIVRK